MVKSVLGVNHRGLRDWAIQRASAIILAFYFIGLIAFFIGHPNLTYSEWHDLFSNWWMKVATILALVSLLYHAWVGMWTVFTDYIKPFALRTIINFIVLLMLAASFIWGVLIVWSV